MKKLFLWVMVVLGWGGMISCLSPQKTSDWKLVWEDDFEGSGFDTLTWSKIPRWTPEWARHMSDNEVCYEVKNGHLILKGVMNPDRNADTARFITSIKRPFMGEGWKSGQSCRGPAGPGRLSG